MNPLYDTEAEADRRRFLTGVAVVVCFMAAVVLCVFGFYLIAIGRFAGVLMIVLGGTTGAIGVALDEIEDA